MLCDDFSRSKHVRAIAIEKKFTVITITIASMLEKISKCLLKCAVFLLNVDLILSYWYKEIFGCMLFRIILNFFFKLAVTFFLQGLRVKSLFGTENQ